MCLWLLWGLTITILAMQNIEFGSVSSDDTPIQQKMAISKRYRSWISDRRTPIKTFLTIINVEHRSTFWGNFDIVFRIIWKQLKISQIIWKVNMLSTFHSFSTSAPIFTLSKSAPPQLRMCRRLPSLRSVSGIGPLRRGSSRKFLIGFFSPSACKK